MTTPHSQLNSEITIRRMDLTDQDADAVARLAELDSVDLPTGPVLGAQVEGRLLAAIALDTGEVFADPFSRTSELRALLKLRAGQLDDRRDGARRRRASRVIGRRHARPAVGGSPAGQIVTLPRG